MIYLASGSPRRKELLQQIGVELEVVRPDVDESTVEGESPLEYVRRLALEKARAGDALIRKQAVCGQKPICPVMGSDTIVLAQGEAGHHHRILGKPSCQTEGVEMLQCLSGSWHQVITAVALLYQGQHRIIHAITQVEFRLINQLEAERYWQTGEPRDKAGGYGIQGLGAVFVKTLSGSYSNVVGLPLYETAELLSQMDINVWQVTDEESI